MRLFMTKTESTEPTPETMLWIPLVLSSSTSAPFHSKILLFLIDFLISSYSRFLIPPRPPTYSMTFGVARGLGD